MAFEWGDKSWKLNGQKLSQEIAQGTDVIPPIAAPSRADRAEITDAFMATPHDALSRVLNVTAAGDPLDTAGPFRERLVNSDRRSMISIRV